MVRIWLNSRLKTGGGLSEALKLRVIEYTLEPVVAQEMRQLSHSTTSRASDRTAVHRLVTTLLDPERYPALDLILCYHERWVIELCIDEIKIHMRCFAHPLRSAPAGGAARTLRPAAAALRGALPHGHLGGSGEPGY